ncbi:MAG: TIGR04283 family arsenosugar biosynthesis glycosyltransferase [Bryobacteraceae bacterium]
MITIIVPTLNEETWIAGTLRALQRLTGAAEILVADGGSTDRTREIAAELGARVLVCPRGRGAQICSAAAQASGDALWIVHADTRPEAGAIESIERALQDPAVVGGNFSLVFEGSHYSARQMTWIYPHLRWLGLSYGDAGMFIRRSVYDTIGGCRPYPLFEDLDLVRRMKRHGRFVHLQTQIVTSSRRFCGKQYARVWMIWITLQVLYWAGVSPHTLARLYR